MKIGIYGDSYADNNFPIGRNDYKNWMDLLKQDGHEVISRGLVSSSLSYAYQHFRQNYKKFDKNIVLVTNSRRMIVKGFGEDSPLYHFNSVVLLDRLKELIKKSTGVDRLHMSKMLTALEMYYQYIQNDMVDDNNQRAMLDSMQFLDPNVLLIPVFNESFIDRVSSLADLAWQDYRHYNKWDLADDIQSQKIVKNGLRLSDRRRCHLTIENNLLLYKKIIKAIKNNDRVMSFNVSEYIPPAMPFEFYFDWV